MRAIIASFALLAACSHAPAKPAPPLVLDHVIIFVAEGAPERAALEKAGFTIAPTVNRHDGSGTASITVEFLNGFLELLYRDHTVPVTPGRERVPDIFEGLSNWRTNGQSPFGLQLARTASAPAEFPFPTVKVHSEWMQPGENLELLTPSDRPQQLRLTVPPQATDIAANERLAADPVKGAMFRHPTGAQRITSVEIVAPRQDRLPEAPAAYVEQAGAAKFTIGPAWRMILTLDGGRQGKSADLNPTLPLLVKY